MLDPKLNDKTVVSAESHGTDLTTELREGQFVNQNYQVLSLLGKGGMGLVYRVNQILLNKEFALKTLDKKFLSETAVRRFQQEAITSFSLDHPSIIAVNEFGVLDDQTPFLVMELVNGESLGDRIKRAGGLPLDQAIPVFLQVCFGLAYAHDCGIVHRDIKPNNIMLHKGVPLGAEGSVKIVDFGIAKLTSHAGGVVQSLTMTGEIFGSPLYMSPEQCSGLKVDHRSDIYSLGCVFFEALTGTPPFMSDNALTTMMKHQSEKAPTLKEATLGGDFPQAIEDIVATMLAKSPENRYQNLGQVAHDLSAWRRGDSSAQSTFSSKVNLQNDKRISMPASIFALLLIAIFVAGAVSGWFANHFTYESERAKAASQSRKFHDELPVISSREVRAKEEEAINELKRPSTAQILLKLRSQEAKGDQFSLGATRITDELLTLISKAQWIHILDLHDCEIDNLGIEKLAALNLVKAKFSMSTLDDVGAKGLSHCKGIKEIWINVTQVTDKGVEDLSRMEGLKTLILTSTKLTDKALVSLGKCKSLDALDLKGIKSLTGPGLAALEGSGLTFLNLAETNIDDAAIPFIAKIPRLKQVVLNGTKVTAKGVTYLLNENKNCKEVVLLSCPISPLEFRKLRVQFPGRVLVDQIDLKNRYE